MDFSVIGRRTLVAFATTVLVGLGLSSSAEAQRPNVNRDLITPGTLLVGSDIPYPPFEMGSAPRYKGFDIDLVNAMAKKLRLKVEIEDTPFDTIFSDLSQGDFDLVASATTITPERKRVVKFTRANYEAQQSLVVPTGSDVRSIRDLRGLTVGTQDGTTGEAFAKDETRAGKVVDYPNGFAVIRALKRGRVDAIILDQPVVNEAFRRGHRGIRVAKNIPVGEKYGYAVKKSSKRLLRGMNWAFARVRADGKFQRIYRKWFGINPPASLRR